VCAGIEGGVLVRYCDWRCDGIADIGAGAVGGGRFWGVVILFIELVAAADAGAAEADAPPDASNVFCSTNSTTKPSLKSKYKRT